MLIGSTVFTLGGGAGTRDIWTPPRPAVMTPGPPHEVQLAGTLQPATCELFLEPVDTGHFDGGQPRIDAMGRCGEQEALREVHRPCWVNTVDNTPRLPATVAHAGRGWKPSHYWVQPVTMVEL